MDRFSASTTEKVFSEKIKSLLGENFNGRVAVAFSGGCDSLALLILCTKYFKQEQIFPVYVNHKIRNSEEITKEIALNKENCCKLGLKLFVEELDIDQLNKLSKEFGTEAAARKLRYEKLEKFSKEKNISFILTAHHKDDQIETVFMKLRKKTPVSSLRGIAERKGKVVRPLLLFSKENLKEFVQCEGFHWSEDSTNTNNAYERNKVRSVSLPKFRKEYIDADSIILQTREQALKECGDFTFEGKSIDLETFNSLNKAKKYIVLYSMWDSVVGGFLSMNMIERVISKCNEKTAFEEAAGGIFCVANNNLFIVSQEDNNMYKCFSAKFEDRLEALDFNCSVSNNPEDLKALHFDVSKLNGNSVVCFPKIGDRIKLKDGSKTVIKVLQDMQIPRVLRQRTPMIIDKDGVVAVFGSVWGGKDRLASRFLDSDYKNLPCVTFTCRNK